MLSDHVKQDTSLAFQTSGSLLLYESSAESRSFLRYFHSAIRNHLSRVSSIHLNGGSLKPGLTVFLVCQRLGREDHRSQLNIGSLDIQLSRVVRKPAFCICENKDADQLRGNREADQRLCFRYTASTISLLSKSEISSL